MLLPETNEAGAERLAERVAAGCRAYIESMGAPIAVRVSVAGTEHRHLAPRGARRSAAHHRGRLRPLEDQASTRSTTVAIPCPTPMHIVARP